MNTTATETASNKTAGDHGDCWTRWFNVDSPADDDGDNETADRIKNIYGKICETGYQILSAQCRNEGTGEIFDKDSVRGNTSDILTLGCTPEGIICKNSAQIHGTGHCQDYSIKFRCHYKDDISNNADNYFSQYDIRIYVILAAVPLCLLLARMWWVYVYRGRKQKRRRNPTSNNVNSDNESADDSTSISSELRKPPPSYKDLFGTTGNSNKSVFTISRETIKVCPLCDSSQCSISVLVRNESEGTSPMISAEPDRSNNETQTEIMEGGEGEEGRDRIIHESHENSAFVHETQNCTTINECSNSVSIEMNSPRNDFEISSKNRCVEFLARLNENGSSASTPSHLTGQTSSSVGQSSGLLLPTRNEIQAKNSNLNYLLNPSWLKPSSTSYPCACLCHRTIPSNHQAGLSTDESESEIYSPSPGMHISVFDQSRTWIEADNASSIDQEELPTYEDALVLTEVKATESQMTSL